MANKHQQYDLSQMQSLPLKYKVRMTAERIKGWYEHYDGQVYISFSGGKDSTVLMDIVRNVCGYDVPAVFVDVPTQYPELKTFATSFKDVTVLKPKISFMQVCEKYGFPIISKEVSEKVYEAKSKPDGYASKYFIPENRGGRANNLICQNMHLCLTQIFQ